MSKTSKNQSGQTANMDLAQGGGVDSRESVREPKRPPRIPMKAGINLHVPESLLERDKYQYRFFAENAQKGGRISSAIAAYWEHVTDEAGNNIVRNGGGGDTNYLMRLPIEYWKEDLALKKSKSLATMDKEYALQANQYIPDGRKAGVTRKSSSSPE